MLPLLLLGLLANFARPGKFSEYLYGSNLSIVSLVDISVCF